MHARYISMYTQGKPFNYIIIQNITQLLQLLYMQCLYVALQTCSINEVYGLCSAIKHRQPPQNMYMYL